MNTISPAGAALVRPAPVPTPSAAKPRIHALDLARAVAVFGMVFSHLGPELPYSGVSGILMDARTGLPSALFAVLTGVSLSIMGTPAAIEGGPALAHSRNRLVSRGILVTALGFLLTQLQQSIAVVLVSLGIAMVLLSWTPRARTGTLVWLALILLLLGPVLQVAIPGFFATSALLGGAYPLFAWLTYVTVGVLVHRWLVTIRPPSFLLGVLAAAGAVVVWAGLSTRSLLGSETVSSEGLYDTSLANPDAPVQLPASAFVFLSPISHTGGLVEQLTNITAAVAVIALCLLLCRSAMLTTVFYPLRATGSMALSTYVLHVLTGSAVLGGLGYGLHGTGTWEEYLDQLPESTTLAFWLTLLIAVVGATLWRLRFRRGPCEELLNRCVVRSTRQDLPGRADRRAGGTDGS